MNAHRLKFVLLQLKENGMHIEIYWISDTILDLILIYVTHKYIRITSVMYSTEPPIPVCCNIHVCKHLVYNASENDESLHKLVSYIARGYRLATWLHDDVIKWKHSLSALLAICAGNSPVTGEFPAKDQWRGALVFSFIWINGWVNNRKAGDLRRYRAHYDVIAMVLPYSFRAARNLSNTIHDLNMWR